MTAPHAKLNDAAARGADKAATHQDALTRAYGRCLRAAGRRASAAFRATQPVTAAANPDPPHWVIPPTLSLIDQQQLADDTQAKTAKLHRAILNASASETLRPFGINFDIAAPTSRAILDGVAARIQGTITSAIEEQITAAIQDGYANGYSVARTADNILAATNGISKVRADMLARSDLNSLSNAGSLLAATTADAADTKTWLATEDERTRETHAEADGQTVGINDTFDVGGESAQYPGDPDLSWEESANCFPGETLVVADSFAHGFRRWYDGDLILVETDGLHRLAGTPNHPVLTDAGWKALGDLEHGDYLVCGFPAEKEAGVDPDVDHVPAKIEEIFASLDIVGHARRIAGANVDFHGEVPDGEVDVVGANGLLRNEGNAAITEPLADQLFAATDMGEVGFFAPSSSREILRTSFDPSDGIMGGGTQTSTLLRRSPGHAGEHSLGAIAGLNAELEQARADTAAADLVEVGKRLLGFPCEVTLSKVVKRNVSSFRGHVYNLQVGDGSVYLANGIIVHNCRCTVVYGQPLTASAFAPSQPLEVPSGGNMATIDTDKLTQAERDELAAKLAQPLSASATRMAAARETLAASGMGGVFDDDELRALEALGVLPDPSPVTASLSEFSLSAAADGGTAWTAVLCVAGVPTVDSGMKRLLATDGGSWLPLPLPLALMDASPHADMVTKAPICGRIDNITVAGNVYQASGIFSDGSDNPDVAEAGAKAAALVGEGLVTGISVDLVDCDAMLRAYRGSRVVMDEVNDPNTPEPDMAFPNDMPPSDEADATEVGDPDDDDDVEYVMCFDRWTIAGATICPVQALTQATISLVASAFQREAEWRTVTEFALAEPEPLTAAAAGLVPLEPPADWFTDPELYGPTPLTVTDEGRVFGHLATWDTCHTGLPGCVQPPRSPTGYMNFHLGEIKTAEGERVSVGTLAFDMGHAGSRASVHATRNHYMADTRGAGAHVRAGEDAWGIWLAGALNPRISAEDARTLMAAPPSGDWRQVRQGEGRDLVGVLAVNEPGFPVRRERRGLSLVAAAEACSPCDEAFARELAVLAASADGIEGLALLASA